MMAKKEELDQIEINPAVLGGQPVIKGTRVAVYMIVDAIADGDTADDILEAYPFLTKEAVHQALRFASRASRVGLEEV